MPKFARSTSYTGSQSNKNHTGDTRAANSVEASAGVNEQLYISPATLASAVGALVPSATTITEGVVYITDNSTPVATKLYVDNIAIAGAPAWSESVSGIGQLSTNAEAVLGTNDDTAMTPLKVASALVAGLPITGGAGSFTTLAASGLSSLSGSATITTGATALNLASDASTGAVNIATGAGARVVTIGNVTGASQIVMNSGTGGIQLVSTGAGDLTLASSDTLLLDSAGVLELNSSAGVISIGNDAVAQAINIGTGASARTITLGNSTGATSLVLNSGTGSINIGTNAIAHNISIGNQTGATAVAIDSGTGSITIGTAIAKTITIGNVTGATAVNINVGTGNFALNGVAGSTYNIGAATTTGTISIGGTAQTGTLSVGAGTGVQTINLGTGGTGVKTINIGTGAVANVITVGTTNTTSALTLNSGSGNVNVAGGNLKIASTGKGLQIKAGLATDMAGTGILTSGTQTIANTNIATGDYIQISRISANSSTAVGMFTYTIVNGTSFTVTSVGSTTGTVLVADISTYFYNIIRPV